MKWFNQSTATTGINDSLQQLALTAQQHPPLSAERQLALSQLVQQILSSGQIGHPQRGQWPASVYEELHREALQKTCLYICTHIDNYRTEHPVMAWVNNLMGYKLKEAIKGNHYGNEVPMDENRDTLPKPETSKQEMLRQFLWEDPEQLLRKKFVRGRPEVTFQRLTIARYIEDQTWATISAQTGISIQTLASFFNRSLRKLRPYFHRHLED